MRRQYSQSAWSMCFSCFQSLLKYLDRSFHRAFLLITREREASSEHPREPRKQNGKGVSMRLPFTLPKGQRKKGVLWVLNRHHWFYNQWSSHQFTFLSLKTLVKVLFRFSLENYGNTRWKQKRCFSDSAQFLVLMVSTRFLQQEEPIFGADRGLCTSAWGVLYSRQQWDWLCSHSHQNHCNHLFYSKLSCKHYPRNTEETYCAVEMLIKFQHPDSDYSPFLGVLLAKKF